MAFYQTDQEFEVAQILLQLPRLIFDYEILTVFSLSWFSKKQRTIRKFVDPSATWKSPISLPNSKQSITRKRKGSENHRQSGIRGGRSRFCAAKDESSKRKKVSQSSNSSAAFSIPDLNLPPLIGGGENCHENEVQKPTLCLRA